MICGRTELIKSVSRAKFDVPSDFEVRFALAPQKPHKNCKKLIFRTDHFADFFFASNNENSGIVPSAR